MKISLQQFRSRRLTTLTMLIVFTVVAVGCGSDKKKAADESRGGGAGTAEAAEVRPVAVSVGMAEVRQVASFLEVTGSLAAQEESSVAPETSGQIIATPVDVGAFVSRGTVLARLDDRDARLRLQQAQAGVGQAVAGVRQAEARLGLGQNGRFDATAIPEVRAALAARESADAAARLAEVNLRRYASLVETGDVARSVYDQARTQAETARAAASSARQQYEASLNAARGGNQGIRTAEAAVESARAQVAIAQKAIDDAVVRAPFGGYVSERPVAVGEYVTPASRIAIVLRTNPIKLLLQVPEAEAGNIGQGRQVSARVSSYADQQFSGTVVAVNPAIDPTSRVLTVEAALENNQNRLRPGMFATARVQQPGGVQGVYIPRAALLDNPNTNSASVYAIERDPTNEGAEVARLKVVQRGDEEGDMVRILSGLQGNETLATSNLAELFDGSQVRRQ